MATNVIMPQLGESIFEGTVTRWLKKVGDPVKRDEPLFEISTDKVDSEIPSPAAGTLTQILVPEGQTVQINTVVGVLDGESGAPAEAPQPSTPAPTTAPPEPSKASPTKSDSTVQPAPQAAKQPAPPAAEDIHSSPLVRKMAKEYKIDLGQVKGTGIGGRITKQDVEGFLANKGVQPAKPAAPPPTTKPPVQPPPATKPAPAVAPPPPTAPAPAVSPTAGFAPARLTIETMSPMRKQIAEHMVMSKRTSAHVNAIFEVDVTPIIKLREREKERFEQENAAHLTFTAFIAKAAIEAIHKFPIVNSSVDGNNVIYKKDINLGIAVALDWGLIVPVIKNAEDKSFVGLAKAIGDLAERARTKKLKPEEVQNGTFTITNPGIYGSLFGTPIINQPQVAILGVGGIKKRPVVIEDDAIAVRSMVILSLSFDHRVIDGAVADQFMAAVKKRLEEWKTL
ncbi:MAG: 2-oxoglutarate dehydrogenase, E2 component, dihydrolipoamide succinyltransferase [Acidobacteriia bacterium]|nr:2-oxoglutarate dehydrogenase, E2 component, dihydrolipoamide succinyltransferase [Terriglobia bacterium]